MAIDPRMLMALLGGGGGYGGGGDKPTSGGKGLISLSGLPLGPLGEGLAGGGSEGLSGGKGGSISQGLGLDELNQGLDQSRMMSSLMSLLGGLGEPSGAPASGARGELLPTTPEGGEGPDIATSLGELSLPMGSMPSDSSGGLHYASGGLLGQQPGLGGGPTPVMAGLGGVTGGAGIGAILHALGLGRNLAGTAQNLLGGGNAAFQLPGIPPDLGYSQWGPPGLYDPASQYGFSGATPANLDPFNASNYAGSLIDPNLDLTGISEGIGGGAATGLGAAGGLGGAATGSGGLLDTLGGALGGAKDALGAPGQWLGQGLTSMLGPELAGQLGSYLPFAAPVIGLGMDLMGDKPGGQIAFDAAVNTAAAALAGPTAGLSLLAAPLITWGIGSDIGPSENWKQYGGKVGETLSSQNTAVGQLLSGILGSQDQGQLQAARDAFVQSFGQRLNTSDSGQMGTDPYTGDPTWITGPNTLQMGPVPIAPGMYLPDLTGATGTQHEWGRIFNPNALTQLLNDLYANKLTSFSQPFKNADATAYLGSILPMIQAAMSGRGGNIEDFLGGGPLPELFANLTPAGGY